jgi:hypothetical protein
VVHPELPVDHVRPEDAKLRVLREAEKNGEAKIGGRTRSKTASPAFAAFVNQDLSELVTLGSLMEVVLQVARGERENVFHHDAVERG